MADIDTIYAKVQVKTTEEHQASPEDLVQFAEAWKDESIPELQRQVAEHALQRFLSGTIDPFFESLIDVLKRMEGAPSRFLDLACASGYYSVVVRYALAGVDYVGADYSPAMIELARAKHPDERFVVADATSTGFKSREFDCVMLSGALEHIPNHTGAIEEICRISSRYVVLHRTTISLDGTFVNALGSQYSILTPKIYFPMQYLEESFAQQGFRVAASRKTWQDMGAIAPVDGHPVEFRTILFERNDH